LIQAISPLVPKDFYSWDLVKYTPEYYLSVRISLVYTNYPLFHFHESAKEEPDLKLLNNCDILCSSTHYGMFVAHVEC